MCRSSVVLVLAPVEGRKIKPFPLVHFNLIHELGNIMDVDRAQVFTTIAWCTPLGFSHVYLSRTKSHICGIIVEFPHLATTAGETSIHIVVTWMIATLPSSHTHHLTSVSITSRTDEQLVHL